MGSVNERATWAKVAATVLMALLVALSVTGGADRARQEYTEKGFKRAMVTFASARAINGLISVAQGREVAIQPGGVGAVLTLGEILDPINDLVEQFSQVMLFSAAVLGIQELLIEISGWFWFSAILAAVVSFWLVTLWRPGVFAARTQRIALALSGILIIARFLVPVAAIANEAVFHLFLAPGYDVANQQLEEATKELDSQEESMASEEPQPGRDESLRGKVEQFFEAAKNKADVSAKIDELRNAANETAEEIVALTALFMIQTLLLPLIFAWLGYVTARRLASYALEVPPAKKPGSPD